MGCDPLVCRRTYLGGSPDDSLYIAWIKSCCSDGVCIYILREPNPTYHVEFLLCASVQAFIGQSSMSETKLVFKRNTISMELTDVEFLEVFLY